MRLGRPPLHQLSYSRTEPVDLRWKVRSRWQFAQTISHLATSSKMRGIPVRPTIRVTADRLDAGSRWSKSIAAGGNRPLQSAHGTSRNVSRWRAWDRQSLRLGGEVLGLSGVTDRLWACRRWVRIRWQLAQTMSHFAASARSTVTGRSIAPPDVSRNDLTVPSRWSKSI
jgi:hypothetical protein